MKEWFLSRQPNEQRTLIIGAVILVIFFLYQYVWAPLSASVVEQKQTMVQQRETLNWIKQASMEAKAAGGVRPAGSTDGSKQSILALVDKSAKQSNLGRSIRKVEPQGDDKVQIWVEQASFDGLLGWLGSLQLEHGINVSSITIDRQTQSGIVNSRLVLSGAE